MTMDVLLKMKIIAFITINVKKLYPIVSLLNNLSASSRDELLETYTNKP